MPDNHSAFEAADEIAWDRHQKLFHVKMVRINAEHPTSNAEHRIIADRMSADDSMLDVGRSMFDVSAGNAD
jgi:hypothetical protein